MAKSESFVSVVFVSRFSSWQLYDPLTLVNLILHLHDLFTFSRTLPSLPRTFLPVTSYAKEELETEYNAMKQLNEVGSPSKEDEVSNPLNSPQLSTSTTSTTTSLSEPQTPPFVDASPHPMEEEEVEAQLWANSPSTSKVQLPRNDLLLPSILNLGDQVIIPKYAPPLQDSSVDPEGIGSHPLLYYAKDEISHELFRFLWSFGQPIVLSKVKINTEQGQGHTWTAEDFAPWKDEPCSLLSCEYPEGSQPFWRPSTIGEFMSTLGKDDKTKKRILGSEGSFKLKVSCSTLLSC